MEKEQEETDEKSMSMFLNHLNNYAYSNSLCFLCYSPNVLKPNFGNGNSNWKESYSQKLCQIFGLDWTVINELNKHRLVEALYCANCFTMILNIEFVMNSIKGLENKFQDLKRNAKQLIEVAATVKFEQVDENVIGLDLGVSGEPNSMDNMDPLEGVGDISMNGESFMEMDYSTGGDELDDDEINRSIAYTRKKKAKKSRTQQVTYTRSGRQVKSRYENEAFQSSESEETESEGFSDGSLSISSTSDNDNIRSTPNKKPQAKLARKSDRDPVVQKSNQKRKSEVVASRKHQSGKLTCILCNKKYKSRDSLSMHYSRQHEEKDLVSTNIPIEEIPTRILRLIKRSRAYSCEEPGCGVKFLSADELSGHIRHIHLKEDPDIKCIFCPKNFYTKQSVKAHYSRSHKPEELDTEYARTLKIPQDVRLLVLKPPPNRQYQPKLKSSGKQSEATLTYNCDHCAKVFKSKYKLRTHNKTVHDRNLQKPRCLYCGKLFSTSEEQSSHEKLHQNSTHPWICVLCPDASLVFQRKSELQRHVLRNHEEYAFRCDKCPMIVLTKTRLQAHVLMHKYRASGKYKCEICNFVAVSPVGLRSHLLSHEVNPIKFDVEGCGAILKHGRSLKIHKLLIHPENPIPKPFKCTTCSKGFRNKGSLEKHSIGHLQLNLRPFICEICAATFKTRRNLLNHLQIHKKQEKTQTGREYRFKERRGRLAPVQINPKDFAYESEFCP